MNSSKPIRTIADIAQLAGVSKSTVSRALSDSSLISDETKARIRTIAKTHNFEIHQGARSLSLQRSQTIAMVFPIQPEIGRTISDPFQLELLGAIADTLAQYDYELLVAQTRKGSRDWVDRYLKARRTDGVIMFGCDLQADVIARLVEQKMPFIVWGPQPAEQMNCNVRSDEVTGGRLATRHLVEQDRQQIAFIGGSPESLEVSLRYQGYEEVLREAGQSIDIANIAYGNYTSQSGYEAMQRLLTQTPHLDAVFVNSDIMGIGVLEALREAGRRVPDDVAVVGYDGISIAAHFSPPLTTVRQNITKAGTLLVQNLIQYLEDGIVTSTVLPVELIVRASSQTTK